MLIVLFHSVLGLRPGVMDFAAKLEEAGLAVITPDLYLDGSIFDTYEAGGKAWDAVGIPTILSRAREACASLSEPVVFAGFSNGAAVAEILAATHPQAKAAVLMHGALPPAMAQIEAWPKSVRVQLHYARDDPFRDPANDTAVREMVGASGASFEEFLYAGNAHLFTDSGLPDYDDQATALVLQRIVSFVR